MIKNAPALEIEDFGFCGYDYRVDIKDDKTFGYLSRDLKATTKACGCFATETRQAMQLPAIRFGMRATH